MIDRVWARWARRRPVSIEEAEIKTGGVLRLQFGKRPVCLFIYVFFFNYKKIEFSISIEHDCSSWFLCLD